MSTPTPITEKPPINTSLRLFDLVRYMRAELHQDGLISDEEYGWLCYGSDMATSPKGGSPSRERLEEYDDLRKDLAATRAENERLRADAGRFNFWLSIIRKQGSVHPPHPGWCKWAVCDHKGAVLGSGDTAETAIDAAALAGKEGK